MALLTILAVLLPAGGASASPRWLPPIDVAPEAPDVQNLALATSPSGEAALMWTADYVVPSVQASIRHDGTFSEPTDVSRPTAAGMPSVGLDRAGDAEAVWQQKRGAANIVVRSVRPAGGTFGAPVDFSHTSLDDLPAGTALAPRIAVGDDGYYVVGWSTGFSLGAQASVAGGVLDGAVPTFGAVFTSATVATPPNVAIGPHGEISAGWEEQTNPSLAETVKVAVGKAGDGLGTPIVLGTPHQLDRPAQVALDATGRVVAAWGQWDGAETVIDAAIVAPGDTTATAIPLSAPGQRANAPQVATDAQGDAIVVWERSDGANWIVQAATRPAGGDFGAPVDLSAPGEDADAPQVAVDAAGDAVVAWQRSDGAHTVVQATLGHVGDGFGAPTDLSAAGQDADEARVAISDGGNAVVAWRRFDGYRRAVQAAAYDATPPTIGTDGIPSRGTAGAPVPFDAAVSDVSSAATTRWDFGDGGSAEGDAVTHAFSAPGSYVVSATAVDAAGNTTSERRTIAIARPAPPTITRLAIAPRALRAARRGGGVSAGSTGARVSYRLSTGARVAFAVERRTAGWRSHGRCVPGSPRHGGRRRIRCAVFVRAGGFSRESAAGASAFRFSGRLGGRALPPGTYRLVATPAAGGLRGTAAQAAFRVVR